MNESKQAIVVGAHKTETTEMSKKDAFLWSRYLPRDLRLPSNVRVLSKLFLNAESLCFSFTDLHAI